MTTEDLAAKGIAPTDWPAGLRRWWAMLYGQRSVAIRRRLNAMRNVHGSEVADIERGEAVLGENAQVKRDFEAANINWLDRDAVRAFAVAHPMQDTVGEFSGHRIEFVPIVVD